MSMAYHRSVIYNMRRVGIHEKIDMKFLFWCKFIFLLNIHCTSSLCNGLDIGIVTYPSGDINIPYPGNSLEVLCTSLDNNSTSKNLYFHIGTENQSSEVLNDTTIRLHWKHPEPQSFRLYCSSNSTRKHCLNKVLIDRSPVHVTDFKCISRNLDSLNCSWSCAKTYTDMRYELTFFLNSSPVSDCEVQRVGDNRFCVWNMTSTPRYRQQMDTYVFNLVSRNVFGITNQNFTIDHFSIVKPDKPYNGTILANQTKPHSVKLFWEIPFNMVDFLQDGVDHKIEYQIAKQVGFHQVDASRLPPKRKNYTFNLVGLPYSYMSYEVRVFIKPKRAKDDQFWSESLNFFFKTASEIPKRPPDIAPGAFVMGDFENHRVIRVYWTQLEEYEKSGANFTYKVLLTQDGRTSTLMPEPGQSLSYVNIDNASENVIHIHVQSSNEMGSSANSSYLLIPARWQILQGPSSFTKFAYENGTYELYWDAMDIKIDNYTLFWCQYNHTENCLGRMNFTTLDHKKNSHVIELPTEEKYQFAMAVNRGFQTSGMVWAKCHISKDGLSMYAFPVQIGHGTAGKTHVNIYWSMECTLREGIITGYNITYCPIIKALSLCDVTVKNESVYIKNNQVNVNITNLLPFRTYRFDLAINTTYGLKLTNKTTYVTTLADVPSEPVNVKIASITNHSLVVSWDPPLKKNGNIVRYLIYNYSNLTEIDSVQNLTDVSRRVFNLKKLNGFTNYSLSVVACNSADYSLCSKPSEAILVRTSIGPPGIVQNFRYLHESSIIKWSKPLIYGGTVDLYQIKRIKDGTREVIYNTTDESLSVAACDEAKNNDVFLIRAINFDSHPNHGAYSDSSNVELPVADDKQVTLSYPGDWSKETGAHCINKNNTFNYIFIFIALFVTVIGMAIGSLKLYKKYRKMEDIKPVLPMGLALSEKEMPKYSFTWNGSNDSGKVTDEDLLLPTKADTQNSSIKQDSNGSSDNTDSTTFSQSSLENQEREASTSDESSTSSLRLDAEPIKPEEDIEQEMCESKPDSETNPTSMVEFKKNPTSGYIQPNDLTAKGYVQATAISQMPIKNLPLKPPPQPTTSSYVMAGLPNAPIFTGTTSLPLSGPSPLTGYIHPDDITLRPNPMHFSSLGPSPPISNSPESLPSMPSLPPSKCSDSSYIQLQSLEPKSASLKSAIRNPVPSKPPTSSGYVSPSDAVINKRLNILAGRNLGEDPVLDPTMSPDAYCRFSWSADPSKDNLTAILADSTSPDSPNQ